jgi:hypothetical protein
MRNSKITIAKRLAFVSLFDLFTIWFVEWSAFFVCEWIDYLVREQKLRLPVLEGPSLFPFRPLYTVFTSFEAGNTTMAALFGLLVMSQCTTLLICEKMIFGRVLRFGPSVRLWSSVMLCWGILVFLLSSIAVVFYNSISLLGGTRATDSVWYYWAWTPFILFGLLVLRQCRRTALRGKVISNKCLACGYLKHGLNSKRCPECGNCS